MRRDASYSVIGRVPASFITDAIGLELYRYSPRAMIQFHHDEALSMRSRSRVTMKFDLGREKLLFLVKKETERLCSWATCLLVSDLENAVHSANCLGMERFAV